MTTTSTLPHRQGNRPLLGLRHTPGRLALAVFRLPLLLYRRGRGRYLGRTFLLLVHTGRRTGQPHEIVAMVLGDDRTTGEVVICSGWGPDVDWVKNLRARPAVRVEIGDRSFTPAHRFLTDDEAFPVAVEFRRRHPWRLRLISRILGWGDLSSDANVRQFVAAHPFVAFSPANRAGTRADAEPADVGRAGASEDFYRDLVAGKESHLDTARHGWSGSGTSTRRSE